MLEELLSQSWTQWVALVAGIIYVILAARENIVCWVFGIVSCSAIAWEDFTTFMLYADGVLQIIYILMGAWGLWQWSRGEEGKTPAIQRRPWYEHLAATLVVAALSWPISELLTSYTDASYGYWDTFTTVLSLYATWLLIRKAIGNWLYWIVIDAIYVYLFFKTGGKLVSVLYFIFMLVAIYGFFEWRRRYRTQAVIQMSSK